MTGYCAEGVWFYCLGDEIRKLDTNEIYYRPMGRRHHGNSFPYIENIQACFFSLLSMQGDEGPNSCFEIWFFLMPSLQWLLHLSFRWLFYFPEQLKGNITILPCEAWHLIHTSLSLKAYFSYSHGCISSSELISFRIQKEFPFPKEILVSEQN